MMKRSIALAIVVLLATSLYADFDFRTTGTQTMTYAALRVPGGMPSVAPSGFMVLVVDPITLKLKYSVNGSAYAEIGSGAGGSGVSSVYGRSGAVVANAGDYLATQVTATPFSTIAGTNVQTQLQQIDARITAAAISSVFGRTGAVLALAGDYTAVKITNTPSGSIAATDVQAAVNELATEKVDRTVANTYTAQQTYQTTGLSVLIKPGSAPAANTKQFEVRSSTDTALASIDAEGDLLAAKGSFSGNVLVNTTGTAAAPLHVFTSGTSTNALGNVTATLLSGASGRAATLQFGDTVDTVEVGQVGAAMVWGTSGTERMRLSSSGLVIGGTTPAAKFHVISTTGTQILSEYDATHRVYMTHNGTNGIIGTATNQALKIQSNLVDAITVDTSQNVGVGGAPSRGAKLEIFKSSTYNTESTFGLRLVSGASLTTLSFGADDSNTAGVIQAHVDGAIGTARTLWLQPNGGTTIAWASVGVGGVPASNAKLHVVGTASSTVRHRIGGDGTANNKAVAFAVNESTGTLTIEEGTSNTALATIDSSGNFAATGGISERGRTAKLGEFTQVSYNAANFTANAGGTWGVDSGDQLTYEYAITGKRLTLIYTISTASITGTPTALSLAIPGGYTVQKTAVNAVYIVNGGGAIGYSTATAGNTTIQIQKAGAAAFSASTNTTEIYGQITFEVQ